MGWTSSLQESWKPDWWKEINILREMDYTAFSCRGSWALRVSTHGKLSVNSWLTGERARVGNYRPNPEPGRAALLLLCRILCRSQNMVTNSLGRWILGCDCSHSTVEETENSSDFSKVTQIVDVIPEIKSRSTCLSAYSRGLQKMVF